MMVKQEIIKLDNVFVSYTGMPANCMQITKYEKLATQHTSHLFRINTIYILFD